MLLQHWILTCNSKVCFLMYCAFFMAFGAIIRIETEIGKPLFIRCDQTQTLLYSPNSTFEWSEYIRRPLLSYSTKNISKNYLFIHFADIMDGGFYACGFKENGSLQTDQIFNVTIYELNLNWIYFCPPDHSALCHADHKEHKFQVLENSTVELGCIARYVNVPDVDLSILNQGPGRKIYENTERIDSDGTAHYTMMKTWNMSVTKDDAYRTFSCTLKGRNNTKTSHVVIEVRDRKNPNKILAGKKALSTVAKENQTLLAFLVFLIPVLIVILIIHLYRKRARSKIKATNRNRSNSILLSRSFRNSRFVGSEESQIINQFVDNNTGSQQQQQLLFPSRTNSIRRCSPPKRPPPRASIP